MANAMLTIMPYFEQGTWVFDDPQAGLLREPFVQGIPEMIDYLTMHIPGARTGFRLLFSAQAFPGYQAHLTLIRPEYGGNWYAWKDRGMEGWLCPALFKYFESAPAEIYCKAEAL